MVEPEVWEEAQPFFFEGGPLGVLVIHGFTGSTQSMRPYGEGLAGHGFTVLGPRLPGHGTSVEDMSRRKYTEWTFEVERALAELGKRCEKVFVTGLSMGGTLTLWLASRHRGEVAGIVPINALVLTKPLMRAASLLKHVVRKIPGVGSDIKNPEARELCYNKVPVPAVHELTKLLAEVREGLGRIEAPALVIASRQDHVVEEPSNAEHIMGNLGSREKELLWLEDSYHVATLDNDAGLIIERAASFFKEH
jgi:carboxylesterase